MPDQTQQNPETLPQQAFAISKRVQISSIWLAHANLIRKVGNADIPESINLTTGVKVNHEFNSDTKDVSVLVSFLAAGGDEAKSDAEDSIFRVEATFALVYKVQGDEECALNHIDAFARMNGIYNAWPYWREYLQSTLGRMELPAITVPVLTQKGVEHMAKTQQDNQRNEKDKVAKRELEAPKPKRKKKL